MPITPSTGRTLGDRLRRALVPAKLPPPINPALLKHTEERAEEAQNRLADRITALPAGSRLVVRALPAAAPADSATLATALDRALTRATNRSSSTAPVASAGGRR